MLFARCSFSCSIAARRRAGDFQVGPPVGLTPGGDGQENLPTQNREEPGNDRASDGQHAPPPVHALNDLDRAGRGW